LEGDAVRIGEQSSPIRAGSFCLMSPAEAFDSLCSAGNKALKFAMCLAGRASRLPLRGTDVRATRGRA